MQVRCSQKPMSPIIAVLLILPMSALTTAAGQQGTPTKPADETSRMEFALRGQRDARTVEFSDWQKFCFKTPGTNAVCRTTISGKWDTGQSAIRIDLIEREGERAARLQLFLPVGLYLQAGAKLTVDQHDAFDIPFRWCLTNTCIAASVPDPALIEQMRTGQQLKLEVADTNLLSVNIMLPLGSFDSVRKAAPTRTFTQDVDE